MAERSKQLTEWEALLEEEIQELRRRRESVDAEIQRVTKKIELIRQMRSLENSPVDSSGAIPPPAELRATPVVVRDAVKKILGDAGRPLHIGEIHLEFLSRGFPIPGSGTPFNILAHVVNDKTFVRVARGTYALAGSVPPDQILPRAPRKKRSRRRKKHLRKGEG